MFSLRWRYAMRDLWFNKTRTILVILSIAIGIFAFGLIAGASNTLNIELSANFQAIQPASATLHAARFDDAMVKAIQRMPEVSTAEGRYVVTVQFLQGGREWQDMELLALEKYAESGVNVVRPTHGAWPPPERELLIERNSLFLTEAAIGDTLLIETSDGTQRTMRIAGLLHDMNQPPAQITGIPYAYVDRDTLEWLGLPRDFNQLHLRVADKPFDEAHITTVAQMAADKMARAGFTVFWMDVPTPGEHFAQEFLPTILLILGILAVLALVLSGFLVINVVTAMLAQQTRQIGVMKAMGARAPQITRLYLFMVLIFGASALFFAIPLGALAGQTFARFVADQLNFDINRLLVTPSILLLEVAVGVLAPVIAALFPIAVAARLTVREAISDQGLTDAAPSEGGFAARIQQIQARLPLPRPVQLSIRNIFRRRGRLIRTLIPLILSGAVFMSVLSVRASLFRSLEETLDSQGFDVQIVLDQSYRHQRIAQATAAIDGIAATEYWRVSEGVPIRQDESEGDSLFMYALPAQSRVFRPDIIAGRWLEPTDTNAIVVPIGLTRDEADAQLGHTITLRIGAEEIAWQVVGVYWSFQAPIAPAVIYANQPYFWRAMGGQGRANTIRVTTNQHDPQTHVRVLREFEDELAATGIEARSTRTASADREIFTERFNIITVLLTVMATLLATVGGLGLMATMGINVLERRREIGVMRAIGASTPTVLQIFVIEGIVVGLLSWLGGLLLSFPISRLLGWRIGMTLLQWPLSYVYDLRAPLIWLVVVVCIAALASLIPARNAASLRVRETLAYE